MDWPHTRHLHLLAPVWTQQLPQHSRRLCLHLGRSESTHPHTDPQSAGALIPLPVKRLSLCILNSCALSSHLCLVDVQDSRWDDSPCNLTLPSICKKLGTKSDGKPQHQGCKQVVPSSSLSSLVCSIPFLLLLLLCLNRIMSSVSVYNRSTVNCRSEYFSFFFHLWPFFLWAALSLSQPQTAL